MTWIFPLMNQKKRLVLRLCRADVFRLFMTEHRADLKPMALVALWLTQ
jgi:hypothetical protein